MFDDVTEYFFICPYCGAEVSMLLDPSVENQEYVEDCEVCCNPINVSFQVDAESGTIVNFQATKNE